jgi:YcxB-like protein
MEPLPLPAAQRINFQVPANVLIGIWWRRMMLRPRRLTALALLLIFSIVCFVMRQGMEYVGIAFLAFLIMQPISIYRVLAKTVDGNSQFTDRKILEFSPSQILVTGPNWKSEIPWTRFKGFSEDNVYFYLHLADNGLASVIPKNAFSLEQQQRFRQYAQTRNA